MRTARRWYDRQTPGLGLESARAVAAVVTSIERAPEMYPVGEAPTRRALLRRFPYALLYDVLHRGPEVWRSRVAG